MLDTELLHQSNLWWAAAQIYLPLLITFRFFAVGVTGLVSYTTGNAAFAESPVFCRELFVRLTAKYYFADSHDENSRQKSRLSTNIIFAVSRPAAHGKMGLCRELEVREPNFKLMAKSHFADGKDLFCRWLLFRPTAKIHLPNLKYFHSFFIQLLMKQNLT